jgi:hypothetical protein
MSGSSSSRDQTTLAEAVSNEDAFTFRVEGMTGIHRAGFPALREAAGNARCTSSFSRSFRCSSVTVPTP